MQHRRNKPIAGLCALLVAAVLLAFTAQTTLAKLVAGTSAEARAQAAGFDVVITPPHGIFADDELVGGDTNDIIFYTPGTSATYHFYIENRSDVTVECTAITAGGDMPAHSVSPQSLTLAPGQREALALTVQAADGHAAETHQQLTLTLQVEQVD